MQQTQPYEGYQNIVNQSLENSTTEETPVDKMAWNVKPWETKLEYNQKFMPNLTIK